MKRFTLAAFLWILAIPLSAFAGSKSIPDWVQRAADLPLPSYPPTTRAVVLLDDEVDTVGPDGTAVVHERRVVKILRQQGREDARVVVSSDVDEKLNYIHAWSMGPDGHQYTVKDNEFVTTSADDEGILYDSVKYKVVLPPAADPGAVIAYEYERRERPYVNEEDWSFQKGIPVRETAFELDLPAGWKYYSAWLRHEPVVPLEPVADHYRWELHDVPAIDTEDVPYAPSPESLAGRMATHYANGDLPAVSGRWAAVGEWYEKLASSQASVTPEITVKAQELTAGEGDFTKKLQSVTLYLQQNIRYVGIEIGIGGLRPHPAEEVFRNRYGDCKDKATLLKTMLAAAGINATWVMVDTRRGFVDPALPSSEGNHMIAAIEIPSGYENTVLQAVVKGEDGKRYLIFDPTDPYTPVGQIRPALQGGYGVLVNGSLSEIIQLPELSPATNLLNRSGKFDLSPDGTLNGVVTEERTGSEAWGPRLLYTEGSAKEQREAMERQLQEDFSSFTLKSSNVENAAQLDKSLVLNYSLTAATYARSQGNLMLIRPRVVGSMSIGLDDKPRMYPIDLGAMRTERDEIDIHLPPGYVVDDTPDPVKIETSFASYHSKIEVQGNLLRYSRELVVNKLQLKPEEYAELRQFMGKITADEESVVVLKKQ